MYCASSPSAGDVDRKVRLAERAAQCAGQIGFVLDDKHSHGFVAGLRGVLGFVFDAEVVEHAPSSRRRSRCPTLGALPRGMRSRSAEHADAPEIHTDLSALLKNFQRVPRIRIELETVLALEREYDCR